MADVAQILGVGGGGGGNDTNAGSIHHDIGGKGGGDGGQQRQQRAQSPPAFPPSHQPSRAVKMQGVSREVLDLLGAKRHGTATAELPPAVPTKMLASTHRSAVEAHSGGKNVVKVGNKWIATNKSARKWAWAPFTSSSRTDGLVLYHWVRAGVEYPDYPYARFDIHLDPVAYSDEEYQIYLRSDTWTKSETDVLMELVRKFELRWAVVHDRWLSWFDDNGPEKKQRKVEDLQHRYYSVAAILTQSRISQEAALEAKSLENAATAATSAAAAPINQPTMNEPLSTTSTAPQAPPPNDNDAQRTALLLETAAARALASADPQHQPLILNLGSGTSNKVFDLNHERERRAQLEALWNRTKE